LPLFPAARKDRDLGSFHLRSVWNKISFTRSRRKDITDVHIFIKPKKRTDDAGARI
jgi:hypothetical protein